LRSRDHVFSFAKPRLQTNKNPETQRSGDSQYLTLTAAATTAWLKKTLAREKAGATNAWPNLTQPNPYTPKKAACTHAIPTLSNTSMSHALASSPGNALPG
jgi:hypothetical protein